MRRVAPETHQLRGTFRPDRHDGSYANFRTQLALAKRFDWTLRSYHLKGLSPAAAAFVRQADRWSMFDRTGGRLLIACARTMDEIAALEAAIRVEGERVAGSRGRQKVNPKVRERRQLERAVARVLRRFHLSPDGKVVQTEKSACRAVSEGTCD